jgi:NADH dehydrogenase, FAD-containing subunit
MFPRDRQSLLTFVVAGGGFAGVETVAALNDFVRAALQFYPNLRERMLRVVLVHPGAVILPELGESLGRYAQKVLAQRGVEIRPEHPGHKHDGERGLLKRSALRSHPAP